jgi:carbon monoxide dehydrogenase subunit G
MPSVTKTVELSLPKEAAFALATDPARFGEWLTLHREWPNGAPSSPATGDQFVQKLSIMGMPADVSWTVEAYEAPSRFVLKGAGPMGAQLATTITASSGGEGSTISYEAEFSGGGIQGPMGEMVTKKAGEELETSLAKLRDLATGVTA